MTLPANVRVNTTIPFPSLTRGTGPITVTKINGIWTIGLAFANLGAVVPPVSDFPTDYVLVWDSIVNTYVRVSLSTINGGTIIPRLPAAAASVPILTSDIEVGINTSVAPTACPLPAVADWVASQIGGYDLTLFDITGNGGTNNVTPSLAGTDTFVQGVVPLIETNFGSIRLRPVISTPNSWFVRAVS